MKEMMISNAYKRANYQYKCSRKSTAFLEKKS